MQEYENAVNADKCLRKELTAFLKQLQRENKELKQQAEDLQSKLNTCVKRTVRKAVFSIKTVIHGTITRRRKNADVKMLKPLVNLSWLT